MADPRALVESVFREESGRIIATLIRLSGSFDKAEEAMQEALISALGTWPEKGIPNNPGAWITAVAHRKLIDSVRKESIRTEKEDALLYETELSQRRNPAADEDTSMQYPDDRLRLMFTCCHPALNLDAQVALTLRTLGGLATPEIARAFLVPEPTMAQRLVRAKRKIQEARIPYEVPPPEKMPERLDAVMTVVYLVFNEGYSATSGSLLIRRELCQEAIRLARILEQLLPSEPELKGLLALMLLQDSRRETRVTEKGVLVTLEEQDRSRWDRNEIREGTRLVETALRQRRVGPYQLQAAIAAVHANAASSAETDWTEIAALYRELMSVAPTPVVALNHAVAVAMSEGIERGLSLIDELDKSGDLDHYYLFHAARADLLRRMGRQQEACSAYRSAIRLATNEVEQEYLKRRLVEVGGGAWVSG
ncbi:MAG TPA: RNA polymerase sigma factor [Terriglobales bacterium]|nr:RNA polymerase sigma factor [Terriglobales bacterium]